LKYQDNDQNIDEQTPSVKAQLAQEVDTTLLEIDASERELNPGFKELEAWVNVYLGPGTAELHDLQGTKHPAIRDENRNAIIPDRCTEIDGHTYFLSIKGCGAYEDMFFGGPLSIDRITDACREPALLDRVRSLHNPAGFIMSENWMGESPFGAQGVINAREGLELSKLARDASINGAYICPIIGIVPLAGQIEDTARKFYWFRQYPDPFFQEMRLVPSRTRLYFESPHVIADPESVFSQFHVGTPKLAQQFEMNFIRSGLALLSLFSRSATERDGGIAGLVYQDVWFDKDTIIAPDGTIHFADIEGLGWMQLTGQSHQELLGKYYKLQRKEWDKLAYEFLYALVQVDTFRHIVENNADNWAKQREGLSFLIQMAIEKDPYLYVRVIDGTLVAFVETLAIDGIDPVQIPIIQGVTF